MASKRTAELIPLCHPVAITFVGVDVEVVGGAGSEGGGELGNSAGMEEKGEEKQSIPWAGTGQGDAYRWPPESSPSTSSVESVKRSENYGRVDISATVSCEGKTGVEMEALTAASVAALTVYDMCKAVDKGMRIEGLRVVRKEGGKSGTWVEGVSGG